jgi:hypothetical protein
MRLRVEWAVLFEGQAHEAGSSEKNPAPETVIVLQANGHVAWTSHPGRNFVRGEMTSVTGVIYSKNSTLNVDAESRLYGR